MSLRDELAGGPVSPTPPPASFRLLCPPGWTRVPPEAVSDELGERAVAMLKQAGRPDLVLQLRAMLSQLRASMRAAHVFEVYLPPLVDGDPLPAVLTVAPFVRPTGVTWESAVARASKGSPVSEPDFTESPMWSWTRDESMQRDRDEPSLASRVRHYVVPAGGDDTQRGLHFVFTVLAPGDTRAAVSDDEVTPARLTEILLETGDVILGTLRWQTIPA